MNENTLNYILQIEGDIRLFKHHIGRVDSGAEGLSALTPEGAAWRQELVGRLEKAKRQLHSIKAASAFLKIAKN